MHKRLIIILFALVAGTNVYACGPLTLKSCREAARELSSSEELYELSDEDLVERKNIVRESYLPVAAGYGTVFYQSDAPDPASFTDLPFTMYPMPKLQFHIGVVASQTIYAGGSKKIRMRSAEVDTELEKQKISTELTHGDSYVDDVFLSILLLRKQKEVLSSQLELLQVKLDGAKEAYESGKAYRSDVLRLEAGVASLKASIDGNAAEMSSALSMLGTITGLQIDEGTELELPDEGTINPAEDPALAILDLQEQKANLDYKLVVAKCLPKFGAFGVIGFGQWSLDFFSHDPNVYGIVGLNLSIPLTSWQNVFYARNLRDNALRRIDLRREEVNRSRGARLGKFDGTIAKYDALLDGASEAVEKYTLLADEMDRLSSGGEASVSEYMDALSELTSARLEVEKLTILRLREVLQRGQYITNL